jgi:hypothetical protein
VPLIYNKILTHFSGLNSVALNANGNLAAAMAEALTTATKLLVVREIEEDESGATLCFQPGAHGRLAASDPNYATHLQLARWSQERQHPVGVSFGEAHAVTELIRADNDVPESCGTRTPDWALVLFEGHDGVFRLKNEHPEYARIHGLIAEALREKARLWFIARKPDLTLLDVLKASGLGPMSAR